MAILRKRALVRGLDVMAAGRRWQDVSQNQHHFEDFVMYPMLVRQAAIDTYCDLDVPEITAQRISMLLGPHYRAVIKAWYIKNQRSLITEEVRNADS